MAEREEVVNSECSASPNFSTSVQARRAGAERCGEFGVELEGDVGTVRTCGGRWMVTGWRKEVGKQGGTCGGGKEVKNCGRRKMFPRRLRGFCSLEVLGRCFLAFAYATCECMRIYLPRVR